MLESLFNIAGGLKVCNSIKKRLQHSCLPLKLAKFLKTGGVSVTASSDV